MKKHAGPLQGKELLILDAAKRHFASMGYSKSTMDEVAADLGMSKASLYYYFPTKEAVFRAVVLREQNEFIVHADGILASTLPAREKLVKYVTLRLDLTARLMTLHRNDQNAWHDVHPVFSELFAAFEVVEQRCLVAIFKEGAASKEFTLAKPKAMAALLLHVLQGLRLRLVKITKNAPEQQAELKEWREESLLFAKTMLDAITTKTV